MQTGTPFSLELLWLMYHSKNVSISLEAPKEAISKMTDVGNTTKRLNIDFLNSCYCEETV